MFVWQTLPEHHMFELDVTPFDYQVAQVALSVVLLAGSGVMVRSFARLARVQPGFASDHVLTLRLALPAASYELIERGQSSFRTSRYAPLRAERLRKKSTA